jgi:hypothetical protein
MKHKVWFITVYLLPLLLFRSEAQNTYNLTFGSNQNFYTTCGTNNGGQWTVTFNDRSCFLYTPILNPVGTGEVTINYNFRINQAGNNTVQDTLRLEYYNESDGWTVVHTVLGNQYNEVNFDISGDLSVNASEYIVFRVHALVMVSQSFWAVKKDNTTFTVNNVDPTTNYLPVNLISFSGYAENNFANIEWVTSSEKNNDFFTIERSDNQSEFYPAGFVVGAGNSNLLLNYRFDDPVELTSNVTYYRLRQTDFDGTTEVTSPIAVKKSMKADHDIWYYIENSTVFINYMTEDAEDVQLLVYDLCGKQVHRKMFSAGKGINTFSWNFTQNGMKGGGMYIFSFIDSLSEKHSMKVVL